MSQWHRKNRDMKARFLEVETGRPSRGWSPDIKDTHESAAGRATGKRSRIIVAGSDRSYFLRRDLLHDDESVKCELNLRNLHSGHTVYFILQEIGFIFFFIWLLAEARPRGERHFYFMILAYRCSRFYLQAGRFEKNIASADHLQRFGHRLTILKVTAPY